MEIKNYLGVETRMLLGLKSTNFSVSRDGQNITFSVIGYGHGVGLSQSGADSLAKQGMTYDQILLHYYTGTNITKLN